ncbi:MAG TPA: hypothetical protein LFV92_02670 [Rickettsia endosymbiont of Ceroptres masudai]|nr:hypothetical protein [Rickettsia endosymbiont of Ceroptres masudai]
MKKANNKLEEALSSMKHGVLNLKKQKASLEKKFLLFCTIQVLLRTKLLP